LGQAPLGGTSSSLLSLRLVENVDRSTCDSGLLWTGGDRPSAEMQPGSDCVGCHESAGARPLLAGGTVYGPLPGYTPEDQPSAGCFGIEGVEVRLTLPLPNDGTPAEDDALELVSVTNRAGNFYFEGEPGDLPAPYRASLRWHTRSGTERAIEMFTMPAYGGCARCHGNTQNTAFETYPGPSTVISAAVVHVRGYEPLP
jgi:mono/diheme cytochrome c family protein